MPVILFSVLVQLKKIKCCISSAASQLAMLAVILALFADIWATKVVSNKVEESIANPPAGCAIVSLLRIQLVDIYCKNMGLVI